MLNLDQIIEQLRKTELPSETQVELLCKQAVEMFLDDPNVLSLPAPITVVGDIHGQFFDLLELFEIAGQCPGTRYLFLGDYVDRGFYSVETFLLLLALKVRFNDRMFLLRGNHESRQISQVYGFYDECVRKYGSLNIWQQCIDVFDTLPLAATLGDKVFCIHGGLSPSMSTIDQIRCLDRQQEVPHDGLMCDLLWSDPMDSESPISTEVEVSEELGDVMPTKNQTETPDSTITSTSGWGLSPRGAGYLFGEDVTKSFLHANNVEMICRAHQLVFNGYQSHFDNKVFTVWSAPNYVYRVGNDASVMSFDEKLEYTFTLFSAASMEKQGPLIRKPIVDYFL
ncbi:hypothetical protein GEMRC1_008492 [Eukaryota sp. GEM-RC1]